MSEKTENTGESLPERILERITDAVPVGKKPLEPEDLPEGVAPEDVEGEIGAEGGSGSPNHQAPSPFHPTKDGTALGDTDQHSNA